MNEAITPVATSPTTALTDLTLQKDVPEPTRSELDKDAFLKLLVAQLKYQDPLDPSKPAEFMATTAQFTTIEKLDELTKQGANNAIVSGLSMASSLVGRQVNFAGADGLPTSGVVTSAEVVRGEVRLSTTAGPVALGEVVGIGLADDGSATTGPTTAQPSEPETGQAKPTSPDAAGGGAESDTADADDAGPVTIKPATAEPAIAEPVDPPSQPPETPQENPSINPPIDGTTKSQQGTADGSATPQQEVNIR